MDTEEHRGGPAERAIEHEADELEDRLERLGGHISEAEGELEERKKAAGADEDSVGVEEDASED